MNFGENAGVTRGNEQNEEPNFHSVLILKNSISRGSSMHSRFALDTDLNKVAMKERMLTNKEVFELLN